MMALEVERLVGRRGNHEGTFHWRRPSPTRHYGRWEGRVALPGLGRVTVNGRKGESRAAVVVRLRELVDSVPAGTRPDRRVTVRDWLDEWAAVWIDPPRVAPRTAESYRATVRLHIAPAIGDRLLDRLSPADVMRMLDRVPADATRRYAYAVLRIALGRARKLGVVRHNVCELVDRPRAAARRIEPPTTGQVEELLAALGRSRYEALITTTIATGLRQGEVCGLVWGNIDLEAGIVHVRKQLERGTRRRVEPKRGSVRDVDLPLIAVSALRSHRVRAMERVFPDRLAEDDPVFVGVDGRVIQGWTAYRAWQEVLRGAGLPAMPFHALRHSFATSLLAEGEELAVVSKLLGHSDVAVTANVYGHLTPAMRHRAAGRIEDALRRKSG